MLTRLGQPLTSGPLSYLRRRLAHYGIDTRHFVEETLPKRPRRRYSREALAEAAARSRSLGEMMQYLGVVPYGSAYRHLASRLKHFGIDNSHFRAAMDGRELRRAVGDSESIAGTVRALGLSCSGHAQARVKQLIKEHGISTAHFTGQGHGRGRPAVNRKTADDILRRLPDDAPRAKRPQLHRALSEKGVAYACGICGTGPEWRSKRLVLEIDHVNGDPRDNRLGNLRYLCPSCHSQTATYSRSPRRATSRSDR